MRSVAILYNPQSGGGKNQHLAENLRTYLLSQGLLSDAISVIETQSAQHAFEMAKYAGLSAVDLVVALGGDGTINKIAAGLYESGSQTRLGIVPSGTVNNLAKALGIPLEIQAAFHNLLHGQDQAVDICQVNDNYMISSLTLGFLADMAVKVTQEEKRQLGFLAFLKYGFKILRRNRNYYLTLKMPESYRQIKTKILLIIMTGSVAGQPHFNREAKPDDGLMNVYFLSDFRLWKLLWNLPKFLSGNFEKLDQVQYFRTSQLEISQFKNGRSQKARTRIDGDQGDYLPIELSVKAKALRVKVPLSQDKY